MEGLEKQVENNQETTTNLISGTIAGYSNQNSVVNGFTEKKDDTYETIIQHQNSKDSHWNPVHIDVILEKVFSFLDLQNIKTCRYVCKKWSDIIEHLLRKRSKVIFCSTRQNIGKHLVSEFIEIFNQSRANLPFTSFSFSSSGATWCISELTEFFQTQRLNIKELEFGAIILTHENSNEIIENCDISECIEGSPLSKLFIQGYVYSRHRNYTNIIFSLHQLKFVKELYMSDCNLAVEKGRNRISPLKMRLEGLNYYCDGVKLEHCQINDYIDLQNMEDVFISVNEQNRTMKLILDLQDIAELNCLTLRFVTTINWGKPKIKELDFGDSFVDLALLPKEIEIIKFARAEITSSNLVCLPKLKFLYFEDFWVSSILCYFESCINLEEIDISSYSHFPYGQVQLNLNHIPKSVKSLKLSGNENMIDGEFDLDLLVLKKCSFEKASLILDKLRAKVVVMRLANPNPQDSNGYEDAILFLNNFNNVSKLYIGPFNWLTDSFGKSRFAEYVDKESSYYVFECQGGNSIDMHYFNSMDFTFSYVEARKKHFTSSFY